MEEMEEALVASKNNIVKGKRTKRQRPQSPIPFSLPSPSNSTEEIEEEEEDDHDIYNPSSSDLDEEEEELANCLLLLAQGQPTAGGPGPQEHRLYISKRYTSKRYVESDGKEGMYVYQCKTCDRAFPSFQALGGHRASHKKPKGGLVEEKKIHRQLSFMSSDCEEEESVGGGGERKHKARTASTNSLVQLQLLGGSYSKSSPKIHECGICGAEFGSGQALGGHMRRHRVAVGTSSVVPTTSTALTLISGFNTEPDKETSEIKASKSLLSLELDLNLPAPVEEEKQQHKQQNQNQAGLVLSTGTLVDCHY